MLLTEVLEDGRRRRDVQDPVGAREHLTSRDRAVGRAGADPYPIDIGGPVIGRTAPIGVAHEIDRAARLVPHRVALRVVAHHVGPGCDHMLVVGRRGLRVELLGVLLRDRSADRQRQRTDECRGGRATQPEDDRLVVGSRDPLIGRTPLVGLVGTPTRSLKYDGYGPATLMLKKRSNA